MALPEPVGLSAGELRSHRLARRLMIPLLVVLVAIAVPLYGIYDVAKVDGPSMEPTLRSGDYMLITRGWPRPARGDVVSIRWQHDGITEELVKRVVALAGDTVDVRGDSVLVNGLPEAFSHKVILGPPRMTGTYVVPPRTVYVLGDNRAVSFDSRMIGPLPVSAIHGKAVAVWAPVTRVRVIPSP